MRVDAAEDRYTFPGKTGRKLELLSAGVSKNGFRRSAESTTKLEG